MGPAPPLKMPKKVNISKKAAAQFQNKKAIQEAVKGKKELTFAVVEKVMGFAIFALKTDTGLSIYGTPRGLFTRSTLPISVGSIVIIHGHGTKNAKGEQMMVEIVGRLEKHDIRELYSSNILNPAILIAAKNATSMANCQETVSDDIDIFERADEDSLVPEDIWGKAEPPKSKKRALAMEEVAANTQALVQKLASGHTAATVATVDVEEHVDLEDL